MTIKNMNSRDYKPELNDVYIGRAGHGHDGYFGNPFVLERGVARETVIAQFREYAIDRMYHDAKYRSKVAALAGKNLVCFCHPQACHGDVLMELSERENEVVSKREAAKTVKQIPLLVCPNCNESITGEHCNICGDNDTDSYNWDSVDTSKGDD